MSAPKRKAVDTSTVDDIEKRLGDLDDRLDALERWADENDDTIARLDTRVDALEDEGE